MEQQKRTQLAGNSVTTVTVTTVTADKTLADAEKRLALLTVAIYSTLKTSNIRNLQKSRSSAIDLG